MAWKRHFGCDWSWNWNDCVSFEISFRFSLYQCQIYRNGGCSTSPSFCSPTSSPNLTSVFKNRDVLCFLSFLKQKENCRYVRWVPQPGCQNIGIKSVFCGASQMAPVVLVLVLMLGMVLLWKMNLNLLNVISVHMWLTIANLSWTLWTSFLQSNEKTKFLIFVILCKKIK